MGVKVKMNTSSFPCLTSHTLSFFLSSPEHPLCGTLRVVLRGWCCEGGVVRVQWPVQIPCTNSKVACTDCGAGGLYGFFGSSRRGEEGCDEGGDVGMVGGRLGMVTAKGLRLAAGVRAGVETGVEAGVGVRTGLGAGSLGGGGAGLLEGMGTGLREGELRN